ncbi:hypothetical protein N9Y42_01705 [Mariniblastus sp.]|nr:hypothetical protein [Mariniblastus sp.]
MPLIPPVSGVQNGSVEAAERTKMLLQFDSPDDRNAIEWIASTELKTENLSCNEMGVVAIVHGLCGKPDLVNRIIKADGKGFFDNIMLPQDDGDLDVKSAEFIVQIETGIISPLSGAKPLASIGTINDIDRQALEKFVDGVFDYAKVTGRMIKTNACGNFDIEIDVSW